MQPETIDVVLFHMSCDRQKESLTYKPTVKATYSCSPVASPSVQSLHLPVRAVSPKPSCFTHTKRVKSWQIRNWFSLRSA